MASKKKASAKANAKAPSKKAATASPPPAIAPATAPFAAPGEPVGASTATPKTTRAKRSPVVSREVERPDPDQPPPDGAVRTSVYSEWLNQPPQAPMWLNSPPPRKPSPTAKRRAAAKAVEAPDPMQALLNDQPPPPPSLSEMLAPAESRPAPRRRTTARRITQAERLTVTSAELEAVVVAGTSRSAVTRAPVASHRSTAPQSAMSGTGTAERSTAVRPILSAPYVSEVPAKSTATGAPVAPSARLAGRDAGASSGGMSIPPGQRLPGGRFSTAPRPPATLGQTASRVPSVPGQTATRLPATRSATNLPARTATDSSLPVAARPVTGAPAARPEVDSEALLIRGARRAPVATTGPVAPRRKGPHPVLTQALVAFGTIVILLVTVVITSPLGYGAAISGTFQAYAQPFIMVPTPTPSPTPVIQNTGGTSVSPGSQVVINDIQAVFGQYASGALNVARCESGYDPNARNPFAVGNSHAEGVFQILFPSTWDGTSYRAQSPYNYDANIHAAYEIFSRDGYSWREWQCQP